MKPENKNLLLEGARAQGIFLDQRQVKLFETYLEVLDKWALKVNLTAIREERNRVVLLLIDSLAVAAEVMALAGEKSGGAIRVMDLGSGAGIPGVPVKIALPGVEMTLCESRQKRVLFLKEVIRQLELSGISVFHGRAEALELEKESAKEKFDLVTSRAVGPLSELAGFCPKLLADHGLIIAMKGPDPGPEIEQCQEEIDRAGFMVKSVKPYQLFKQGVARSLVLISRKIQAHLE